MEWCSRRLAILQRAGSIDVEAVSSRDNLIPVTNIHDNFYLPFSSTYLGANHKTLRRPSQATAAHHPHLVKVQIVSTTAHRRRPSNVPHRRRHRVWTTTSTAAIWSTTSISSRRRRSRASVTIKGRKLRMACDRRTSTMFATATASWTRWRGTMMTIMGE